MVEQTHHPYHMAGTTSAGLLGPWSTIGDQSSDRSGLALEIDGARMAITADQIHDLGNGIGLITDPVTTSAIIHADQVATARVQ